MADRPNTSFRPSMNWVHTWSGVVLGALLFINFRMGAISVFDREIDRWMQPQTRLANSAARATSYDGLLKTARAAEPGKQLTGMQIATADTREPFTAIHAAYADKTRRTLLIDPGTGCLIPEPGSLGGTGFLYPMHIDLILPRVWGGDRDVRGDRDAAARHRCCHPPQDFRGLFHFPARKEATAIEPRSA